MNERKQQIRQIIIDIITGKISTRYTPDQQAHLFIGVATVLLEREGPPSDARRSFSTPTDPALGEADELLALEVFSDLIIDKVIVPGKDRLNPLPFFRKHSEWTP